MKYNKETQQKYYKNNKDKILKRNKEWKRNNIWFTILNAAKFRAGRDSLEFSLIKEDIQIPELCPVLGIPLKRGVKRLTYNSPTLDRIDSRKGYTKDNIKVISWRANSIKNDATIAELEAILKYMKDV